MNHRTVTIEAGAPYPEILEMIESMRNIQNRQISILERIEGTVRSFLEQEGSEGVCRENNRYPAEDYLPDYILDDKGFIVDVLPDGVKVRRDNRADNGFSDWMDSTEE